VVRKRNPKEGKRGSVLAVEVEEGEVEEDRKVEKEEEEEEAEEKQRQRRRLVLACGSLRPKSAYSRGPGCREATALFKSSLIIGRASEIRPPAFLRGGVLYMPGPGTILPFRCTSAIHGCCGDLSCDQLPRPTCVRGRCREY